MTLTINSQPCHGWACVNHRRDIPFSEVFVLWSLVGSDRRCLCGVSVLVSVLVSRCQRILVLSFLGQEITSVITVALLNLKQICVNSIPVIFVTWSTFLELILKNIFTFNLLTSSGQNTSCAKILRGLHLIIKVLALNAYIHEKLDLHSF